MYLENLLKNVDQQVSYSKVSLTIREKESDYANIVFVKLSELASTLVVSLNSLLLFAVGVLPWAVALLVLWAIWKLAKRK